MFCLGQSRRFERAPAMSVIHLKADIRLRSNIWREGPTSEFSSAQQSNSTSAVSSAILPS
jgi:hypothetical protein